jgi:hypothetical protein
MITSYLRERIPPAGPPPERRFISYLEPNITIAGILTEINSSFLTLFRKRPV